MNDSIYEDISILLNKGVSNFALVLLINHAGSTPRHIGTKMIVKPTGEIIGTIGGGILEKKIIDDALIAIKNGKSELKTYHLTPESNNGIGMTCGGSVSVFIDLVNTKDELLIIGAGHIGVSLCQLASATGFKVVVAEDRASYAMKERFPEADSVHCIALDNIPDFIKEKRLEYVVLVNRHSDCDLYWLKEILKKKEAQYVGCIGSKMRIANLKENLLKMNIDENMIDTIYGPIGLDIGAETPEEIAVSILSQIIRVKHKCN